MFDSLMKHISEQRLHVSGAVDRPEMDRDYGGVDQVAPDRQKLEQFVLRNTPCRHKYETADGQQGIVYFDSRGRAASCTLSEIPDEDLMRVAHEFSKRFPGEPNHSKPQTGRREHGYPTPVQESQAEVTRLAGMLKARGWRMGHGTASKGGVSLKFEESRNDPAVWVTASLDRVKVEGGQLNALADALDQIRKGWDKVR